MGRQKGVVMAKERVDRDLAEAIRALMVANRDGNGVYHLDPKITPEALVSLVKVALGDELWFYPDADQLVWDVARHMGFIIPACPVESRGDAREFLQEYGVRNAPEWYRARGFDDETLRDFYATSALMARNTAFWRKVVPVPKLASSKASALAPYLVKAIDFCLGEDTGDDDETLFRC